MTNADGEAVLKDLPKGYLSIQVSHNGYVPRFAGGFTNYGRTLETFKNIKLAKAESLSGRVTTRDGTPLEDVRFPLGLSKLRFELTGFFGDPSVRLRDSDSAGLDRQLDAELEAILAKREGTTDPGFETRLVVRHEAARR